MSLFYHGKLLTTPMGPAGPDGNPIGTILSFLGLTPPKDYLVCDGSVLNIEDYQDLATFFETQFGTKNHFGGDGETTFALPDMRNLFLRGWHGEAEEQLSGDVGAKQEGTIYPNIYIGDSVTSYNPVIQAMGESPQVGSKVQNTDSIIKSSTKRRNASMMSEVYDQAETPITYTSRPVNTAVLYCIKAVESIGYDANNYSLEEKRIGTWIDGKPLYRRMIITTSGSKTSTFNNVFNDNSLDIVTHIEGKILTESYFSIPDSNNDLVYNESTKNIQHIPRAGAYCNRPLTITIEYTKTID